jgi:uncharacterized protein (DUF433 family)
LDIREWHVPSQRVKRGIDTHDTIAVVGEEWIEPNPQRPGAADMRLKEYGVPVWALIGHLEVVNGDITLVARDYDIPGEAVDAALAYYNRHKAVIDARIAANSA